MSRSVTEPLLAALSLAGLWMLAMVLEAMGVPVWALVLTGGLLVVNVIVLTACLYRATRDEGRRDGGGGAPPHGPDIPEPGGGRDPSWWPELERELEQYLAEHEAARTEARGAPAGSTA
jgi:hypothetical protein